MTDQTPDTNAQLLRALSSLKDMRSRLESAERARTEPIAIVGMACRLPGAPDTAAFWDLVRRGGDAVTETPAERWDAAAIYDPAPEAAGKVATRWGGFLDGIDRFDAAFFGISPREAAQMDPQQRLLLEVAWEAFEDGGQAVDELSGTATGVFVGVHSHSDDYYLLQAADPRALDLYSGTGTSHSVLSGRLSYLLDLRGPSVAVDTACSSSLVAAHLAVQSLRNGECSLAVAGGVNLIVDPTFTVVASRMRMMSPTGRCRPFDAGADGFVRAEGCAAVVLKRLSDAAADGDRILAVIHGSAVNQDGRSNGLTAPNGVAQEAVIRAALANANVGAGAIGLIEAHGTGTPLGDPIEVAALSAVFEGQAPASCALGSVKANIGHAEGAAGVAGLVKAVLALRNREIPPVPHFDRLNPHISLDATPFTVPTDVRSWPAHDGGRYAGVSSFGWSGTNAHLVVGEAPEARRAATTADGPLLLPVSARNAEARRALASSYRDLLRQRPDSVDALCATASRRRAHHDHRLAVTGRAGADLAAALDAFLAGAERDELSVGRADARSGGLVAFVFPGQGSQWRGMGRELIATEPAFRHAIDACARAMAPYVEWSLVEQLVSDDGDRFDDIDVVQPCLFAVQVALAAWWRSHGVVPDSVVGHSMGEVAAAHVAGILTLDDAARIICRRSSLLRRIRGRGAMAVVELSLSEARETIGAVADRVAVAVSNSPTSTVLSGDPDALAGVMSGLERRGVFCRRVKVDVASHSPQVDELRADLAAAVADIRPRAATVPFLSTVTGRFEDGPALDADYWVRNLRQPVLFGAAVAALVDAGHSRFVELSPHPALVPAVTEGVRAADRHGVVVPSMRRDADEGVVLRSALGALYADGFSVDWKQLYPDASSPVDLPRYPWQREHFWLDAPTGGSPPRRNQREHPWLGWPVPLAGGTRVWENDLEASAAPPLFDHRIGGRPSVPAAGLVEIVRLASAPAGPMRLTGVRFERLLDLDDDNPTTIQLTIEPDGRTHIDRRAGDGWTRHLAATLAIDSTPPPCCASSASPADDPAGDVYERLTDAGVKLGPALRSLVAVRSCADGVEAELAAAPPGLEAFAALDGGLQAAAVAALEAGGSLFVPTVADDVWVAASPSPPTTCRVTLEPVADVDVAPARRAAIRVYDGAGALVAAVDGLSLQRVGAVLDRPDDWFYAIEWQPAPELAVASTDAASRWLLVGDDSPFGRALAVLLDSAGIRHTSVRTGAREDLTAALESDGSALDRVVVLSCLDDTAPRHATEGVERWLRSAQSVIDVARAVSRVASRASMWAVTRSAQAVLRGERVIVDDSPVWGLGRVIAEEHPELWGGLIDVDAGADMAASAADVVREVLAAEQREVAVRGGERWLPRLTRRTPTPAMEPVVPATGTYLVTGGFGVVGEQVGDWLVAQGARRLVLLSRRPLPAREEWSRLDPESPEGRRVQQVLRLEHAGASVHVAAVDVSDRPSLSGFLEQFRAEGWPSIRGVFHAAAVFGGAVVDDLTTDELAAELGPKAIGAVNLDALLPDVELFVLFSSVAALLPLPGDAAYAAANAVLDALAHDRVARGKPALAVDWGYWSTVRQATGAGASARLLFESRGMRGFAAGPALAALGRLCSAGDAQALVLSADWTTFGSCYPDGLTPPLAVELVRNGVSADDTPAPAGSLADDVAGLPAEERLEAVQATVARVVGGVMKLPETRLDPDEPFGSFGLDSLTALELRNRLERRIGRRLSATLAWNYPTIRELSAYVLELLDRDATVSADGHQPAASARAEALAVADLSDDDAVLALMHGAHQ